MTTRPTPDVPVAPGPSTEELTDRAKLRRLADKASGDPGAGVSISPGRLLALLDALDHADEATKHAVDHASRAAFAQGKLAARTEDWSRPSDGRRWAVPSQQALLTDVVDAILRDVFQGRRDAARDAMLGVAAKVGRGRASWHLDERLKTARAEAWREGYRAGANLGRAIGERIVGTRDTWPSVDPNPYDPDGSHASCHPDCVHGPVTDHDGSRGYACVDATGATLPFPATTTGPEELARTDPADAAEELARAIYADGDEPAWLTTVDGSPNAAAWEHAHRVLESGWLADHTRTTADRAATAALHAAAHHYGVIWGTGETTEAKVARVLHHWADHGIGTRLDSTTPGSDAGSPSARPATAVEDLAAAVCATTACPVDHDHGEYCYRGHDIARHALTTAGHPPKVVR